ncbi:MULTISPECIES: beta-N-acetylhexosaminidase [Sphingopyxis]|jgi:beta-N-acetylhexosaminidase|uniref:beta-N-acetylhexosaminidase n=1 Tax=Sphingopyxis TaxID=165697 RepID=UPI0002D15137|nr:MULTISPECIES: beta-N-acetylhexosaminidase [Sphingopyxis]KAB2853858.1 MAG: beta-N-acetylhexosaminidase [Sphingopyxis terrae]OJW20063.1 MAG: beta-hexosaminidase [Sphingopyxis sp. 65-8]ENY80788.1 beta-N-acetylhexosaminidase [Sphingopyxis sp. MC1]KTE75569.1 beta-hexosaminidase [Sphingopyxis sp. A083]ODU24001.1 MAG: beta-hexosaminidase [Sphingopyxis sp. SCN 67-31]
MIPAIFGLSGLTLTDDERAFFRDSAPAGYILFGRNIENRTQLRRLTDTLRELDGRANLPILIDQEGGRVARMKAPEWPDFPSGAAFDALYERAPASAIEAARLNAMALASMLAEVGITVDCLPLLDVRQPGASDVIGDRALGSEPMRVAALGRAILSGLQDGGVVGVVKHIPGHGRALLDSHKALPVVDAHDRELQTDLAPFAALRDAAMAMTCHVIFKAWDPDLPATLSPTIIGSVIRQRIGFHGLLMTDDLDMEALSGDVPSRAAAAIAAGCDLALNCWAKMDDMVGIANALDPIGADSLARLEGAMERIAGMHDERQFAALIDQRDALLALA